MSASYRGGENCQFARLAAARDEGRSDATACSVVAPSQSLQIFQDRSLLRFGQLVWKCVPRRALAEFASVEITPLFSRHARGGGQLVELLDLEPDFRLVVAVFAALPDDRPRVGMQHVP